METVFSGMKTSRPFIATQVGECPIGLGCPDIEPGDSIVANPYEPEVAHETCARRAGMDVPS